jgi:hypothetical protein
MAFSNLVNFTFQAVCVYVDLNAFSISNCMECLMKFNMKNFSEMNHAFSPLCMQKVKDMNDELTMVLKANFVFVV